MPNRYIIFTIIVFCVATLFATNIVESQTQFDIPASKDNTLYESATGALSSGSGSTLFVGRTNQSSNSIRRGLVAFNLAEIPVGAKIESVSLTLRMSKTSSGSQNIELHRFQADWGEGKSSGSGSGASSTTNDATWIHRFFNTDMWASPGGDFSSTVSASQSVGGNGSYTWDSTTELVADVQHWLDNPLENFGWILIGVEGSSRTSKRFDTRENSTESNRPVLSVSFSQPTSVEANNDGLPDDFNLAQNYPNPFNPSTVINYNIPESANLTNVRLDIYNVLGQLVKNLVDEQQSAGPQNVQWDGRDAAVELVTSGVYIYSLKAGEFVDTKKMIFVR